MSVRILFALVMAGSTAACTSETPEPSDALKADPLSVRAVGSMKDSKGHHICNVVMLAPDIAATDVHCIKGKDTSLTVSIYKPDGTQATSGFKVMMEGSEAFALAFSTNVPDIYKAGHAELASDQAILKLDKPIADEGAIMQVTYASELDWQPLADTNLMVADIKFAAHNGVRMLKPDAAPRNTDRTRLLTFDCKIVKSPYLDMVISHTCPTKGGSSGGALYKKGPKGEFMLVALHTGTVSPIPNPDNNPPYHMIAFEYIQIPSRLNNGFSLELYDMSGGRELPERNIKTGVIITPLVDGCRLSLTGCKIP